MSRPPAPPAREQVAPGDARTAYDAVTARRQAIGHEVGPYFGALLNVPELADLLTAVGTLFRTSETRGTVPDRTRELASLAVGVKLGCSHVVRSHAPDALAAGVSAEAVGALIGGRLDRLESSQRELVHLVDAVVADDLSDAAFEALRAELGVGGAVELVTFVAYVMFSCRAMQALGVPQPTDAAIRELLRAAAAAATPEGDQDGGHDHP